MKYTAQELKKFQKNYKTIAQVARICDTDYDHISSIIAKENIIPVKSNPYMLDEDQQTIIFMVMHYEQRTRYLVFPSKMNEPEPEPIYSNRNDFIKNGNITAKGSF